MNRKRAYCVAAAMGGLVYVLGGLDGSQANDQLGVEAYDPSTNQWHPVDMPKDAFIGRAFLSACARTPR